MTLTVLYGPWMLLANIYYRSATCFNDSMVIPCSSNVTYDCRTCEMLLDDKKTITTMNTPLFLENNTHACFREICIQRDNYDEPYLSNHKCGRKICKPYITKLTNHCVVKNKANGQYLLNSPKCNLTFNMDILPLYKVQFGEFIDFLKIHIENSRIKFVSAPYDVRISLCYNFKQTITMKYLYLTHKHDIMRESAFHILRCDMFIGQCTFDANQICAATYNEGFIEREVPCNETCDIKCEKNSPICFYDSKRVECDSKSKLCEKIALECDRCMWSISYDDDCFEGCLMGTTRTKNYICPENSKCSKTEREICPDCICNENVHGCTFRVGWSGECDTDCSKNALNSIVDCSYILPNNSEIALKRSQCHYKKIGTSNCLRQCSCDPILTPDCSLSSWEEWSPCSVPCGIGNRYRRARCTYQSNSVNCTGRNAVQWGMCAPGLCVCDAQAKQCQYFFTDWSPCSVTCGGGKQTREFLYCTFQGIREQMCAPNYTLSRECNIGECPCVDESCVYIFTNWTACSKSCGGGLRTKIASSCSKNGVPVSICQPPMNIIPSESCNKNPCICSPDMCQYLYTAWTDCSRPCGGGYKTRAVAKCEDLITGLPARTCKLDGLSLNITCNTQQCECNDETSPDCVYQYTEWSECSEPCGGGTQTQLIQECHFRDIRTNHCFHKDGTVMKSRTCNDQDCVCNDEKSLDCTYQYTNWTACSRNCGRGFQNQSIARCTFQGVPIKRCSHADGTTYKVKSCNIHSCSLEAKYTSWSNCSKSCGGGVQVRDIICEAKLPGQTCKTNNVTERVCNNFTCICTSSNCTYHYGAWSYCSKSCGLGGYQRRNVTCIANDGESYECTDPHIHDFCYVKECKCPKDCFILTDDDTCHCNSENVIWTLYGQKKYAIKSGTRRKRNMIGFITELDIDSESYINMTSQDLCIVANFTDKAVIPNTFLFKSRIKVKIYSKKSYFAVILIGCIINFLSYISIMFIRIPKNFLASAEHVSLIR